MRHPNEEYVGDGVYVHFDGYQIWITTQRETLHEIALEPSTFHALVQYEQRLRQAIQA